MKNVILVVTLCLALNGNPVQAQFNFCEYYSEVLGIDVCSQEGNILTFEVGWCRSSTFQVDLTTGEFRVDDRVFSATEEGIAEYANYISEICSFGGSTGFTTGSYSDPVVGQSLTSLFERNYQNRLVPNDADAEAVMLSSRVLSGGIGGGSFSSNGAEGKSSGAQLSYALDWESGYSVGTNVSFSKLSFDSGQNDLSNAAVNLYAEKAMTFFGFEGSFGAGYNHLFMDDRLGDDGKGLNLFIGGFKELGKHRLTTDFQVQYTKLGELIQNTTTLSASYGIPIGRKGALNADLVLVQTGQEYDGRSLPGDDFFSVAGLIYDFYMGDFVLKAGARKVFMLDGYSNLDIVLSGGFRY